MGIVDRSVGRLPTHPHPPKLKEIPKVLLQGSKFYKGSVVRPGKKATHKCPRIEGGLPGPSRLQGPVPEPNSASCDGQLNSGSLYQQTRRNSLSRDVCSPVEDHDLVPLQGDPKDQAMPLPDHRNSPKLARNALVLGPSAAHNRDPTTTPSVNDPTQTVPLVCVPQHPHNS